MRKIFLSALVLSVFIVFSNCTKEDDNQNCEILTNECFENNLTKDITYQQLTGFFGEPHDDLGSGIHIYRYELADKTEVYIGYTGVVLYAYRLDQNGNFLNDYV